MGRWCRIFVVFLIFAPGVLCAGQIIIVDARDPSVSYPEVVNSDNGTTWIDVSAGECNDPQRVTRKLGDYATFKFKGTALEVRGTTGSERGFIGIQFDGENTTFDRVSLTTMCDFPIFQLYNLENTEHTVTMILLARNESLSSPGTMVGLLSLQSFRYTHGSDVNQPLSVGAIVGIVLGSLATVAFILIAILIIRGRRIRSQNGVFRDNEDAPPDVNIWGSTIPGAIVTPFEWQSTRDESPSRQVLLPGSAPISTSRMDEKRRMRHVSVTHASRMQQAEYVSSGPSNTKNMAHEDTGLWVDRIAMRVADFMDTRADSSNSGDSYAMHSTLAHSSQPR